MKVISKGDSFVSQVLGKKALEPNAVYRWSDYVIDHSLDNQKYLYNNLTKKCFVLDNNSFTADKAARYTSDEISALPALTQFVADRFLVREDLDEAAVYEGFCKIARAMKLQKKGYSKYTILPTTACNARCIYCYEEGIQYTTMKDDVLSQTIEFVKQSHNPDKPVTFTWFGGEPLIGEKMIDAVCAAMREAGIEYRSQMISNGSLITGEIIQKMADDWHLQRIQITLDGVEEEYNRRKNYYFNYESAYWHILSRIKLINEAGINLNIRVNVDEGNIDGVLTMLDDVKNFIPNKELVSFDLAPLFDLQSSEAGWKIWEKTFDIAEKIVEQGFKIAPHYSVTKSRYNYCMADVPYEAVLIVPDGKLYHCEHFQAMEPLGDVWTGVTNTALVDRVAAVEHAREQCKRCFSLPYCTTFSGCPNLRVDCKYANRKRLERALNKMIRNQNTDASGEDLDIEC